MVNRPFPVNPVQTAISIGFRNDRIGLIADKVLPRVPVAGSRFSWLRYPIGQAFTVPDTEVGRRGRLNRVEFSGEQQESSVIDHGLEDSIPIQDIDEARAQRERGLGTYDPESVSTLMLTDLILLDREVRVASLAMDPASYAPGNRLVLSGGDKFSDYTSSDPIGVLKAAFDKPLIFRPNTMTMGRQTWGALSSHPHLVNAVKGNVSSRGIVTPAEFLDLFRGEGLTELLIGEASINTARKGQPASFARAWSNHISLTYINPQAQPMYGATFGMTAEWGRRVAGTMMDPNVGLDGGVVVRVGERVREIITAPEAGYLIQNAS